MTTLSLRISIVKSNNVKMMQFDENVVVYDAMRIIRERVPDAAQGQGILRGHAHLFTSLLMYSKRVWIV